MVQLDKLNPQQRDAATTIRGPVLILAGAGTGKTRVITSRIAYMVSRGVPPGNILAVTFTNKAAREMQERVNGMLPKPPRAEAGRPPDRPTICTFHSLCVRILRKHIDRLGYKPNFVIYDEAEQLGAMRKILSGLSSDRPNVEPGKVLAALSKIKNSTPGNLKWGDPDSLALAEHLRSKYESALHACNAVDFDDLLLLALRLLDEHPDVLEACRERYRYIMVDEYQDTNAAQFRLVQALANVHRNLCVVGDDDQSIYGWRGAEIANLLDLEKFFPEVKVVKLEQNYRSTTNILDAANAVIRNNAQRRSKKLWSAYGQGRKIRLFAFLDDEEEARTVVEEIEAARLARRVPWGDQAVLFRTNQQSRPLETAFRKAGVRYHLVGGQSFFDRREVRDLLAYLKVFVNPNDDISLLRIANVPARGMSETTMSRLLTASHERRCSVFAVLKDPVIQSTFQTRAREAMEKFALWIEERQKELHRGVSPKTPKDLQNWATAWIEETGYYAELRRSEKDAEAAENRVRNVREMIADLDGSEPGETGMTERLDKFLEEVCLDGEREEDKEKQGNVVTLITMHSCKGLEFPHVHIVGLEEGLLPHSRSKEEGTLDEERRLFYVAITRARQTLSMSHCAGRRKYGSLSPMHPSRFLAELPKELLESGEELAKKPVPPSEGKNWFAMMRAATGDTPPEDPGQK